MKWLMIAMVLFAQAAYAGPRTIGNGGGGVVRNGVYMTFGSAGVYVDPEPVGMEAVPGMDLFLSTIRETGMSESEKDSILRATAPFGARAYFNVIKEKFDEATYEKLRREYAVIAKQPPESIVIFAVTDPKTRKTFLLPEFFGLRVEEQAAILFHEAYWILKPKASYQEVVSAEVAFQKYLEQKAAGVYDPNLAEKLSILFGNPSSSLNMHLKQDLRSGALAELVGKEAGIPADVFFTDKNYSCDNHESYWRGWHRGAITGVAYEHIYDLAMRFPKSHFLRGVLNFVSPDEEGKSGTIWMGLAKREIDWIEAERHRCYTALEGMHLLIDRVFHDGRVLYLDRADPYRGY